MDAAPNFDTDAHDLGAIVRAALGPGDAANLLPQILDFTQAHPLRDTMAALLSGDELTLDASAVERMSTPCAQVLLATGRAAAAAGASFKIINASDAFRTALADLGLQDEFSSWMI
jgi:anti-anti-sigma regulatory factor